MTFSWAFSGEREADDVDGDDGTAVSIRVSGLSCLKFDSWLSQGIFLATPRASQAGLQSTVTASENYKSCNESTLKYFDFKKFISSMVFFLKESCAITEV